MILPPDKESDDIQFTSLIFIEHFLLEELKQKLYVQIFSKYSKNYLNHSERFYFIGFRWNNVD